MMLEFVLFAKGLKNDPQLIIPTQNLNGTI